jgi:hypothetical protein
MNYIHNSENNSNNNLLHLDYIVTQKNVLNCKKASNLCDKYLKIKTELCKNW